MTVQISASKSPENKKDTAARQMLKAYLDGALKLTAGKSKADAERIIKDYHQKADNQALKSAPDALDAVKTEEKSLKEKASSYPLKAKVNYASDADFENIGDLLAGSLAAVATPMLAHIVAQDPSTLGATMFVATASYMALKAGKLAAAELSASKNDEEKKNAQAYADVKHAQLALKLLKKEIEAPLKAAEKAKYKEDVAQLFAAGYGQPSGGFVQTQSNQKNLLHSALSSRGGR